MQGEPFQKHGYASAILRNGLHFRKALSAYLDNCRRALCPATGVDPIAWTPAKTERHAVRIEEPREPVTYRGKEGWRLRTKLRKQPGYMVKASRSAHGKRESEDMLRRTWWQIRKGFRFRKIQEIGDLTFAGSFAAS